MKPIIERKERNESKRKVLSVRLFGVLIYTNVIEYADEAKRNRIGFTAFPSDAPTFIEDTDDDLDE